MLSHSLTHMSRMSWVDFRRGTALRDFLVSLLNNRAAWTYIEDSEAATNDIRVLHVEQTIIAIDQDGYQLSNTPVVLQD